MSFLWNLVSKAKITEEQLKQNSIPILDYYKLSYESNTEPIIITGFGKFYKGLYDNKEIFLKVVDITQNENILTEFILWKKYQKTNNFLTLKGIILYYNSAFIIFNDCFKCTLKTLLLNQTTKPLNEIDKINISKQILDIINIIQNEKEINSDIRPETLIINTEQKVKLIDFGLMLKIPDFINNEAIKIERIKYSPPEYILESTINNSYDIYSFGCILIDIFSTNIKNTIMMKSYEQNEDYIKDVKENKYIKIPDNFNYLLHEIIKRCINPNPNKRIKINELYFNLNILLNKIKEYNSHDNINEIEDELVNPELVEDEQFKKMKNLLNYSKEISQDSYKYEKLEDEFKIKIDKMKKDLDTKYKNNLIEINQFQEKIKKKIDEVIEQNKELMKSFYDKTLENIVYYISLLSNSMSDILDIKKSVTEMQILLISHNQFINKNKYENIENILESSKSFIDNKIKKYTKTKNFDIIDLFFENCAKFVNKNEELKNNYITELNKIYDCIKNTKNFFGNDDTIEKELDDQILIQKIMNDVKTDIKIEEIEKENEEKINLKKKIYAKIVENSNMISIFNYQDKKLKNYYIKSEKDSFKFNSNCFSLYDQEQNCLYISGGIKDIKDPNSHDDSFYRIDITFGKSCKSGNNLIQNIISSSKINYEFNINKLCSMYNKRSYHSMIQLSSNKNMIFSISGINTDSCEIYNIDVGYWIKIQELPTKCQSPGLFDIDNYIYVFPYSKDFNNIYRMNIATEEELMWESIKYSINEGNLKKGMTVLQNENFLLLLGGYDDNGIYSKIYEVELNNEDKDINIKLSTDLKLPNNIYFNSNYLLIHSEVDNDKNILDEEENEEEKEGVNEINEKIENEGDEEKKNKDILMIMDNYNGVLEYYCDSGEFKYYLEK